MSKIFLLLGLVSIAQAGVVIKTKHFEGEQPKVEGMKVPDRPKVAEMVHTIQGSKAKMESFDATHQLLHATLFDADAQTFTNFNAKTKTYSKLDKAKFSEMQSRMKDYFASMKSNQKNKEMLSKLPPEAKKRFEEEMKRMEKMQADMNKPAAEPKKIAENVKVGKWTCTKYEEEVAGSRIENCNIPFSEVGIGEEEMKFFEKMAKMMEGLLGPAQMGPYTKSFLAARMKIGFPVATWIYHKDFRNQKEFLSGRTEMVSVEKKNIPAAEFAIPAGYTEQKLERPMMGRPQRIPTKGTGGK